MFAMLNGAAWREYNAKRREIHNLSIFGAHEAEIAYMRRALKTWVREQVVAERDGPFLVPL